MAITTATGEGPPNGLPGDPGSTYNRTDGPPFLYRRFASGWVAADIIGEDGLVNTNNLPAHSHPESDLNLADNTTSNASASQHGLLPKLANTGTQFLRDDGTWQVGPQGPQGPAGNDGNDGADGATGPQGEPGDASAAWPIGAVFISVVATNPATLLGFGTWAAIGAGRMLVGFDSGDTDFDTAEETGGAKTHTLTTAEMPSHTHQLQRFPTATGGSSGFTADTSMSGTPAAVTLTTQASGGGGSHNNMPPYFVCHFWKRTA